MGKIAAYCPILSDTALYCHNLTFNNAGLYHMKLIVSYLYHFLITALQMSVKSKMELSAVNGLFSNTENDNRWFLDFYIMCGTKTVQNHFTKAIYCT